MGSFVAEDDMADFVRALEEAERLVAQASLQIPNSPVEEIIPTVKNLMACGAVALGILLRYKKP